MSRTLSRHVCEDRPTHPQEQIQKATDLWARKGQKLQESRRVGRTRVVGRHDVGRTIDRPTLLLIGFHELSGRDTGKLHRFLTDNSDHKSCLYVFYFSLCL